MQTIPLWLQIFISILTIIIGALLSAYISYKIFIRFSINKLKKYFHFHFKIICNISYNDYGIEDIFKTMNMVKSKLDETSKLVDEINKDIYKLKGNYNEEMLLIRQKVSYLLSHFYILNMFISEHIINDVKPMLVKFSDIEDLKKTDEYKYQEWKIQETFHTDSIIDNMCFKSSDIKIQKEYENFLILHNIQFNLINLLDNKRTEMK